MQFRSEFYDAFNHSNYYINTGNLDVDTAPASRRSKP